MIASKKALCAALALGLASVSGFAFAQSAEYRQGYDQGYRDGMEAQSHADHGGPIGRIIIEEAHYGKRDQGFCDARDIIQHAIGWRRHFDIHVGNELCGDSQPAETEAPESSVMALSCQ